jgi:hypothetical protein
MLQLLPLIYGFCYMVRYLLYSRNIIQPHKASKYAITYAGTWHCFCFVLNLLYLSVTSHCLELFSCKKDQDSYYLLSAPSVKCYEGEHVVLMGFAIVPLLVFTVGWPAFLLVAFRNAKALHLLHDKDFKRFLGFVYSRFEVNTAYFPGNSAQLTTDLGRVVLLALHNHLPEVCNRGDQDLPLRQLPPGTHTAYSPHEAIASN